MSKVISVHLGTARCHQIKKRRHIQLSLVKVFSELKKDLSLKWNNPPWEAFSWREGWKAESWVTQLILRLQDLWQSVSQSVQSLSHVQFFATPWTAVCQASLSITNSWSLLISCPSSRWCHLAISSSVIPFLSCLHSLPASGSFPMTQIFASGGQSIGVSASTQSCQWILRTDFL